MLGFGTIVPIVPFYIKSFDAGGLSMGLLISAYSLGQFFFAPIWGVLSDRYGRKPILVIGIIGNALSHLMFALSTELWMLFASRILAGVLSSATMPTAMAYIGDSTTEKDRGASMGKLAAAIGLGVIIGPGLGGPLATISLSLPFFIASALSACALIPVWTMLPESLPKEARHRRSISVGHQFKDMWKALFGPIAFLLVLAFLVDFGLMNWESVFGLFALDRYGYGPDSIGYIIVMVGIISVIMQGILTGPLTKRFGEVNIMKTSLLLCAISYVVMLAAETYIGVMLTVGFFVISNSLLRPSLASYISKNTVGGQGVAMGLNNSFMGLGRIIGPAFGGMLFDTNINTPYIAGGIIMFIGFVASLIWLKAKNKPIHAGG